MTDRLPCPQLFTGHDNGHYSLPDDVIKARDTHTAAVAMPYPQPPRNSWETVQDVAVATADALRDGTDLPDVALIEQARQAERIYQDAVDMMGAVLETTGNRVKSALRTHAPAILTGSLRPALDETWKAYKDAHRILAEHGDHEPRRLLNAPAKVRKASDTCDQLAARYEAIAAARGDLWITLAIRCEADPNGKYTLIRNYHELHATRWANVRTPWHGLTTRQYLDYMAANGGQLWLPTPDEQAKAVDAEAHLGNPMKRAAGF
ncbi:hypothetical protein ACGFNV_22140 [Streptomyces sp. NPDC048751]|uniref:hypothetical protein n=1 Tax=Streptomyces sp. NPDC048751 TaxID=3365591 RepID=UPI00371B265B